MRPMRASPLMLLAVASCFGAPPTRAPLHDLLSKADTPQIEDATRTCLTKSGWRVDPVGELVAGANTVSAAKGTDQTQVYIQAPDMNPRVTGGPDSDDAFWSCLSKELKGAPEKTATESAGHDEEEHKAAKPVPSE